jgi:hypothetical protein
MGLAYTREARSEGPDYLDRKTVCALAGVGVSSGHWGHREPAPHGAPAI